MLSQLKTLIWLRWRLTRNQLNRGGKVNLFIGVVFALSLLVLAVASFFGALIGGAIGLFYADPNHILIMWDVILLLFLFGWSIGVMVELQRSELLSLEKLLHFPLSLSGCYLLNYLSGLVTLTMVLFAPAMLALCIASVIAQGLRMLPMFLLVPSYLLMVSAVTYQLRGWLAALMMNKRRRRTIIVVVTLTFVGACQIPGAVNMWVLRNGGYGGSGGRTELAFMEEEADLRAKRNAQQITREQFHRELTALERRRDERTVHEAEAFYARVMDYTRKANLALPIGWLPYGAQSASAGNVLPALCCAFGMMAIGGASLWRSYHTTLSYYTKADGVAPARKPRSATAAMKVVRKPVSPLLNYRIRGVSEQVSAIAFSSLCMLTRAPETKMVILTPLLIVVIFGSIMFTGTADNVPVVARPFAAIAAVTMSLIGMSQMTANAFGLERHGFKTYILMPIERRDILLGKNLGAAPIALLLFTIVLAICQFLAPLRLTHAAALLIQGVPVYLAVCLVGNVTSIVAPVAVSSGSLKPTQPSLRNILAHMGSLIAMPLTLLPAVLAVGAELLLEHFAEFSFPLFLVVSIAEFALMWWLYPRVLEWEGRLLQDRECEILEVVCQATE